jgi:membrane protein YqaA with SNARE-associated domain
VKISPAALINKWSAAILAAMKPFGVWGIGALAIVDSAAVPLPIDAALIYYVVHDHAKFILYCFMAAFGSAIGSLLPFFIGRAGGELFLLKRINRKRYEQLRDRFERQEFLALMIPAMMPPPMPVKLFEFAAGVFEMRTVSYFLAILLGKFIRFLVWAIITLLYGPQIVHTIVQAMHEHIRSVMGGVGVLILVLAIWVTRKVFDRRKGVPLPLEDEK